MDGLLRLTVVGLAMTNVSVIATMSEAERKAIN